MANRSKNDLNSPTTIPNEAITAITNHHPSPLPQPTKQSKNKSKLKCTHCSKTKHTKEKCFELQGYPEWWKNGHKKTCKKAATVGNSEATNSGGHQQKEGGMAAANGGGLGFMAASGEGMTDGNEREERGSVITARKDKLVGKGVAAAVEDNPRVTISGDHHQHKRDDGHSQASENFSCAAGKETTSGIGLGFGNYFSNPPLYKPSLSNIYTEYFLSSRREGINLQSDPQTSKLHNVDTNVKGEVNMIANNTKNNKWIFDCGATDTMTFEKSDICYESKPRINKIQTANGGVVQVKGGGTIEITPTLKLSNCLYIPTLSHKLLSVSHVTKELNCSVLLHPTFCILQDIRTGVIIGRGTERGGLYYVDEVTQQGTVMLAHGTPDREAWLWHRRLGHPSASYLNLLFPKLFPPNSVLTCETCILAKSHKSTFKPNNTRKNVPFSLIHSDVWGPAQTNGGRVFGTSYFLLTTVQE